MCVGISVLYNIRVAGLNWENLLSVAVPCWEQVLVLLMVPTKYGWLRNPKFTT